MGMCALSHRRVHRIFCMPTQGYDRGIRNEASCLDPRSARDRSQDRVQPGSGSRRQAHFASAFSAGVRDLWQPRIAKGFFAVLAAQFRTITTGSWTQVSRLRASARNERSRSRAALRGPASGSLTEAGRMYIRAWRGVSSEGLAHSCHWGERIRRLESRTAAALMRHVRPRRDSKP